MNTTEDEWAAGTLDGIDQRLLDQLATLHDRLDPVPEGLVDRITFGITLDALEAEIAQLQRVDALAGARAEATSEITSITFTSSSVTAMITVTPAAADRVRIDGWLALVDGPAADMQVEARTSAGPRTTTADEDGRFVLNDVVRGFVQFVLRPAAGTDGSSVITPSIGV